MGYTYNRADFVIFASQPINNPKGTHMRLLHNFAAWTVLLTLGGFFSLAQAQTVIPNNLRASISLQQMADANGLRTVDLVYGIPLPPGRVIGDTYLNTQWMRSSFMMYNVDKTFENYKVRYDIRRNELEVKTPTQVKVVEGNRLKNFAVTDSLNSHTAFYANGKDFTLDGKKQSGFYEVLEDGKLALLKKTEIEVKKADYNAALNIGSLDEKILKKDSYFVLKGTELQEVRKKKFFAVFGDQAAVVQDYADKNKLSVGDPRQLELIVRHYNSLGAN
jgi:hypothetical protein